MAHRVQMGDPKDVASMGGSSQGEVRCAQGNPPADRSHPKFGTTEGTFGVQIVRLQSDNGGEFIHETLIGGCQARG
eukprot:12887517-Prorocentrum_lima.AAC.1